MSTRIADRHQLDEFDCGVDSLNRWLVETARRADRQDTARTYVWTAENNDRVVAYFSITPTQLNRRDDGLSRSASGGLDRVPAFLIAKLAVDLSIASRGNGRQLVLDAISRIIVAADQSGGRMIVVDAIDDRAAAFYTKLDFVAVRDNPHRLYMKVATARRALGIG
ncbi:MAG: GNAT family N-acetyltransferase [Mycobacterium sp.]